MILKKRYYKNETETKILSETRNERKRKYYFDTKNETVIKNEINIASK